MNGVAFVLTISVPFRSGCRLGLRFCTRRFQYGPWLASTAALDRVWLCGAFCHHVVVASRVISSISGRAVADLASFARSGNLTIVCRRSPKSLLQTSKERLKRPIVACATSRWFHGCAFRVIGGDPSQPAHTT